MVPRGQPRAAALNSKVQSPFTVSTTVYPDPTSCGRNIIAEVMPVAADGDDLVLVGGEALVGEEGVDGGVDGGREVADGTEGDGDGVATGGVTGLWRI
jgi:hypothetical protein